MLAAVGVLLIAVGIVAFQLAARAFQRPTPPRWARGDLAAELITISVVAVGAFGLGLIANFAIGIEAAQFGLLEGGLILAIVIATVVTVRFIGRLPKADSAAAVVQLEPREPPVTPRPSAGGRKRAA